MMVKISVGYPGQQFRVLINTVSATTWLIGLDCEDEFCRNQRRFDWSLSSTHMADGRCWRTDFGLGARFEGKLSEDSMNIANVTIDGQLIGQVSKARGWILNHIAMDGVIGLGSSQAVSLNMLDPIENMFQQGLLDQQLFALYLVGEDEDDDYYDDREPIGEITLGGIDESHFSGQLTHVNIINRWSFYIDYVSVPGSDVMYSMRGRALIDSTSNVILAPPAPFNAIMRLFGTKLETRFGLSTFSSCDDIPDKKFKLVLNGSWLTLSAKDLVIKVKNGPWTTCYLAHKINAEIGWLLGTPFLQKYYTIFDYSNKRLSFGLSTGRVK